MTTGSSNTQNLEASSDMPREILRAAKIVDRMTKAHAAQKGAVGLDLADKKGNKEMIDAPMLKQVTPVGICYSIIRLISASLGREDYPDGARRRPSHPNTAMRMTLPNRNHVDAHQ